MQSKLKAALGRGTDASPFTFAGCYVKWAGLLSVWVQRLRRDAQQHHSFRFP